MFFNLGFLSQTSMIYWTTGEGKGISLNPLYHFHPLQKCLDSSREITAKSSLLPVSDHESLEPG